jgi:hypothetical protein
MCTSRENHRAGAARAWRGAARREFNASVAPASGWNPRDCRYSYTEVVGEGFTTVMRSGD